MKAVTNLLGNTKRQTIEAYLVWKIIRAYYGRVEGSAIKTVITLGSGRELVSNLLKEAQEFA
jgi:hypothetical protein